jgi:hypothetical protein
VKVLIGCERSGIIRDAFRDCGHDAWSCDFVGPDDAPDEFKAQRWPNYHLEGDVQWFLGQGWDLFIVHPDCRRLCVSGNRYHANTHGRFEDLKFVQELLDAPVNKSCLENPVGVISSAIRKPDQYIQPYQFGHDASKQTGLWLKNLPPLVIDPALYVAPRMVCRCGAVYSYEVVKGCPTCGAEQAFAKPRWANQTDSGQNRLGPSDTRSMDRARTYEGIANAMAEQWGSA